MQELQELFVNEKSMRVFMERYWQALKESRRTSQIEFFGWEAVAEEIERAYQNEIFELGDYASVEIGSYYTKTGNPEIIEVGKVVKRQMYDNGEFVGLAWFGN